MPDDDKFLFLIGEPKYMYIYSQRLHHNIAEKRQIVFINP